MGKEARVSSCLNVPTSHLVKRQVDFSERSGFLNGRKFRLSIGEIKKVLTDKLEALNLGGNKGVSGNLAVLAPCLSIRHLDLCRSNVHGEMHVLEKCFMLTYIDLGDTKVAGNLATLKACPNLEVLSLRWSKVVGAIEELEGLPLKQLDLMVGKCSFICLPLFIIPNKLFLSYLLFLVSLLGNGLQGRPHFSEYLE